MAFNPLSLLPLLLLLSSLPSSLCQAPPPIDVIYDDKKLVVNLTRDTSKVINCPNRPGFLGITDRSNSRFVARELDFTVDLNVEIGSYDAVRRIREEKLGAYHCLYKSNDTTSAYAVVLSELPDTSEYGEMSVGSDKETSEVAIDCPLKKEAEDDTHVWEKLNMQTGLFEPLPPGSRIVSKNIAEDIGYTTIRCYSTKRPTVAWYQRIRKAKGLQMRYLQNTNYSSILLPEVVDIDSNIQLVCQGKEFELNANESVTIFFKVNGTSVDPSIAYSDKIEKKNSVRFVQLVFTQYRPEFEGVYTCVKDGVRQAIRLSTFYGLPILSKTGKHVMKSHEQFIDCRSIAHHVGHLLSYVVKRQDRPPLRMTNGSNVDGIVVDFHEEERLFMKFNRSEDMHNATVECWLVGSKAVVTFLRETFGVSLSGSQYYGSYSLICQKNREFGNTTDTQIVQILSNGTRLPVPTTAKTIAQFTASSRDRRPYVEFQCETRVGDQVYRSEKWTHGTPQVKIDLVVNDDRNPAAKALLAGRDVNFRCEFSGLPSETFPVSAGVSLSKDGAELPLSPRSINATTFGFVMRNAGSEMTGNYTCRYRRAALMRTGSPLTGEYSSPTSALSFCEANQFVCDMRCANRSILCDGKRDCKDGSDEAEEQCSECQPNEVKCLKHNGTEPKVNCVLKHWLCDAQDDCGNGYDEDTERQKKWCYKPAECSKCEPGFICCASNSTICIRRQYECDKEPDCPGGTDERNCNEGNCIRITEPTSPRIVELKVGDPLNLTCIAEGNDRPTTNWRRNWAAAPGSPSAEQTNTALERDPASAAYSVMGNLLVGRVTKAMAGIYNCEAVNNCGRMLSAEIQLKVSD